MSITARDRKVLMILAPLILLMAFWFMVLAPKRDAVKKADAEVTKNQEALDAAKGQLAQLKGAKNDFQTEYASVVRLGKAIPSNLDMPSLLVQLDSAARGTGIKFERITAGDRAPATPAAATPPASSTGATQAAQTPNGNAAPGGAPAQSTPGKAAEKAGNAVNTQNQNTDKSGQVDTTTSTASKAGGLPVGGGSTNATAGAPGATTSGAPGLDSVPLQLDFSGNYFALSNFLHRMKRFVKVNNEHIRVSGRLITIDGMELKLTGFGGKLTATMRATVYLVPKDQGVAAGATPAGPAGSTPAAGAASGGTPTPTSAPASGSAAAPTAVVHP